MAAPFTLRWGILATGGIANAFCKDLLVDPAVRGAGDVAHEIVAVASRSAERAAAFAREVGIPGTPACYGSYEELAADGRVGAVYIATPHSHHFRNAMMCLRAGKHVLCEKALTVNAAQARILVAEARTRGLFLMEAVWTRFFPMCVQIRQMIREGVVGEVLRVFADTSHGEEDPEAHFGTEHRIVNPQLAGGVLLDSTLYSLTWCFQTLYHTQPASSREPPCKTSAQVEVYPATGTDEAVTILLTFPRSVPHGERRSQAVATGSLRLRSNPGKGGADDATPELPCARIQGTKGEIAVYGMCWQPRGYKVVLHDQAPGTAQYIAEEFPGAARGMNWEADEVARCIRDGKLESDTMGWEESLAMMDTFDEIRRQAGLVFPAAIETTELA